MAPHWNHMMVPRNQDTILVEVERHLPSTGKTIGTVGVMHMFTDTHVLTVS